MPRIIPDSEVKEKHRLALKAWSLGSANQQAPNDAGNHAPIFNSRQLLLASMAKPVTPFGGLVSLIEFFNALKLGEVLALFMPAA